MEVIGSSSTNRFGLELQFQGPGKGSSLATLPHDLPSPGLGRQNKLLGTSRIEYDRAGASSRSAGDRSCGGQGL